MSLTKSLTAQDVFGPTPWVLDAGGAGPQGSYGYNPWYFATRDTADLLAAMLDGAPTVTAVNQITGDGGPYVQHPANLVLTWDDAPGVQVNAGLLAALWTHGWPAAYTAWVVWKETGHHLLFVPALPPPPPPFLIVADPNHPHPTATFLGSPLTAW